MADKFFDFIMEKMGFYKIINEKKIKDKYGYTHIEYSYTHQHGGLFSKIK